MFPVWAAEVHYVSLMKGPGFEPALRQHQCSPRIWLVPPQIELRQLVIYGELRKTEIIPLNPNLMDNEIFFLVFLIRELFRGGIFRP